MFTIVTLNSIAQAGLDLFPNNQYQIQLESNNPDAILVRSASLHDMPIPPSLRAIGRAGAGVNNIPINSMTALGIPVFNTPGANANAVCELVIASMLLGSRHLCNAWQYVNQLNLKDEDLEDHIEKKKKQFIGREIAGKTLGLVGLGNVGVKVANAALHLGMRVVGYDPLISVSRAWELSSAVNQAKNVEEICETADFISFHIPLNRETKNMINDAYFNRMKQNVILLNFAREGIIDINSLISSLKSNKIGAYLSDFPNNQLKNFPNAINFPHLGASTYEAESNCAVMITKAIRDFLEVGSINNSVNFPSMDLPPIREGARLTITNQNIPNMVAQISAKLGEAKLNIQSLWNKSKESIAYTVIDIDKDVAEGLLKELQDIEGVIQIRKLMAFIDKK